MAKYRVWLRYHYTQDSAFEVEAESIRDAEERALSVEWTEQDAVGGGSLDICDAETAYVVEGMTEVV